MAAEQIGAMNVLRRKYSMIRMCAPGANTEMKSIVGRSFTKTSKAVLAFFLDRDGNMTLDEAKAEGQRWLDYLKRQEEKSVAIQRIAGAVRRKEIDSAEGKRQLRAIDDRSSLTVYDGTKLADAVKLLIAR